MRVSYAQRLEDYHLERLFHDVSRGFYVDVGGGHPVADNVSFHFYLRGWHGLVAEPQVALAARYAHVRPRDIVISDLVGRADGEAAFHAVERLHGFSTMIEANAQGAAAFGAGYRTERRRVRSLASLFREHAITGVDFVKIDVEGAEADVLAGMDWRGVRPKVFCIEAVLPGSMAEAWLAWEPMLTSNGYRFAYFDELNRFYVAEEHAGLAARFPVGVSDWGVVRHFYEFEQADRNAGHPDHALARRLVAGFLAGLPELPEAELRALLERSAGKDGLEQGAALTDLMRGALGRSADGTSDTTLAASDAFLDDGVRAALGRIAAQYDGGMISDE